MVGHETTSAAINFSLLELARNPEMQEKLRKEVTDFVGSGPGGEPTYEEYQSKLPYLDAVCKEGCVLLVSRMSAVALTAGTITVFECTLQLHMPSVLL